MSSLKSNKNEEVINETTNKSLNLREKDIWDKMASFGPITSLLIAMVGGMFTFIYSSNQNQLKKEETKQQAILQQQQNKILEIQAIESLLPYLVSEDTSLQKAAIVSLGQFSELNFVTEIAVLFNSQGILSGLDYLMKTSGTFVPNISDGSIENKIKWIYLGQYLVTERRWTRSYLDFDDKLSPVELKNNFYSIKKSTGTLNVRNKPLGDVIDTLEPMSKVKIVEVYYIIGYIWATVEYVE